MKQYTLLTASLLLASTLSYAQERPLNLNFDITHQHIQTNACHAANNNRFCLDLRARESGLERTLIHQTTRFDTRINTQLSEHNGVMRATSTLRHKLGTLSLRAVDGELREARYTRPIQDWNISLAYDPQQERVRAQLQRNNLQLQYVEREALERRFFLAHEYRFNTQLPAQLQSGFMLQTRPQEDYSINSRLNVRF